ncbi:serine/threonine/tyrosine protein kinase [Martiniozyma asiatica (nom. inval.)]|nr:serine/threonine/tyrosine protein kinase [Martiniozyma asiatica]
MSTSEYLVRDVTSKTSGVTRPMVVREITKIGEGAFGTVLQANLKNALPDQNGNQNEVWFGPFAIKKVPAQTEYKSRELALLKQTNHPNIVSLKYYYNYPNKDDNGRIYQHLAMECLPCNLQSEIKRYYQAKMILPEDHIKIYTFQIARAMNYLHSFEICHRDIKPSNILIDPSNILLKICDFGSAKKLESDQPSVSYICSRYYRAPELIVGCCLYSTKIDIWGLGCVMGEMYMGKPVFQGQEPMLQLREISKLLGPPPKDFIFESNPQYTGPLYSNKLHNSDLPTRFQKVFKTACQEALDLLMKVLVYSPTQRYNPTRIMADPFFDEIKSMNFTTTPRTSSERIRISDLLFNFSDFEMQTFREYADFILPRADS